MNSDYVQLAHALLPEAALILGALLVLGIDLAFLRKARPTARFNLALMISALAVVAAFVLAVCPQTVGTSVSGVLALDPLAISTREAILVLALIVLGIASAAPRPSQFVEYIALLLFSTAGVILMAAAQHLLVAFLALELTSIPLYALVAFNRGSRESSEAALKYFLYGGISAAFLLFGFSLLYGLTGALDFSSVTRALAHQETTPLLSLAWVMILVALGYKVAAAPFHLWAPDAYQGAPTPIAGLIASASKVGGLIMFARLLWPTLTAGTHAVDTAQAAAQAWLPTVALLSAASLILGNIAALAQTNLRRLLAYSAIAHAGLLLLGIMVTGPVGAGPLYYYAVTYGIATAGAFGVIAACERGSACQRISDLAGLSHRSPLLAGCLMVFVLSLAGIPPLAGFFGKFFVFSAAFKVGGLSVVQGWLSLAAILVSVIALYYYLLVLKQAWIASPPPEARPLTVSSTASLALLAAAAALIALGVFPQWLLGLV